MASRWQVQVQIPDQQIGPFVSMLRMPDDVFHQFLNTLRHSLPALGGDELAEQVATALDVSGEIAQPLVSLALSLYSLRSELQLATSEFVDVATQAVERLPAPALEALGQSREHAPKRIRELLEIGSPISTVAKATDLALQYERTFTDARILTDIRPLFADDPTEVPEAVMIQHTLKIAYFQGFARREFFVTLGSGDLRILQDVLQRATQKAASAEQMFKPTVHILKEAN